MFFKKIEIEQFKIKVVVISNQESVCVILCCRMKRGLY